MAKRKLKPGKAQTIISLAILMVLFGICIGIKQSQISPAVIAMQPAPLDHLPSMTASETASVKTLFSFSKGVTPLSPLEIFDQSTLSDKINGKADFYLAAGFIDLTSQRFTMGDDSDSWKEIFVYDMRNGANAYAVFSAQKRQEARSLNITHFCCVTENALFFIHGSNYIEMIASKNTRTFPSGVVWI